jgi:hypothetical protein
LDVGHVFSELIVLEEEALLDELEIAVECILGATFLIHLLDGFIGFEIIEIVENVVV